MTGENDNLAEAGTDTTNPSDALDNPDNLNFWEPGDEEPDTSEGEEIEAETDSETDEPEDGQEADQSETADDEPEDGEEGDELPEPDDGVTVTVNGEKLALSALKSGYMRQQDYSRKTAEVAEKRKALEALSNRVTTSVNAIAQLLTASVPPMPDQALALTDPQKHYRMKVLHDTAMAKVAEVIEKANEPKAALEALSNQQRTELLQSENAKLSEAFPQTTSPEGRKKFFENTTSAARELGFTDEELAGVTDHRLFKLAHYARIGLAAEAAKAKAAKKVANVPPVAPAKRQPSTNASKAAKNREAMKRLDRTGSIHDAMAIDFD